MSTEAPHRIPSDDLAVTLRTDGPVIFPASSPMSSDLVPFVTWHEQIIAVVTAQEPWAILGRRTSGHVRIFDTSSHGIFVCAGWAHEIRLIFGPGTGWTNS